jgi:uncharacterized repeat protein (TIGR03803 family)
MTKFNWTKSCYALILLCATTAIALRAQTLTTVHIFNNTDGARPYAALVQGTDGNLYGTTSSGGANMAACGDIGCGTVFKITPGGTLTALYSFCSQSNCTDGSTPYAALVQASDGDLYGTTWRGGAYTTACNGTGCGTVFKITRSGTLTTLHSFAGSPTDGGAPTAALVQDGDGNFYGTTTVGGANNTGPCAPGGCGTVFKITRWGRLTTLHSFDGTDGMNAQAPLVQDGDGNFYGTTLFGGEYMDGCGGVGCGTVFKITPWGELRTLYSFCSQPNCTDGSMPYAALVKDTNGGFYGTTSKGGANYTTPPDCAQGGCGTVFKITPWGALTTVYSFCSQTYCTDGAFPYYAALVRASDGDFYGTTAYGGLGHEAGTVFKITPWGTLTTLFILACTDTEGCIVDAGLVQDRHGKLYGTTHYGPAVTGPCPSQPGILLSHGCGTVFSLSGIPR